MAYGVSYHRNRRFDRVPEPSNNAAFPVLAVTAPFQLARERVMWTNGDILDQGAVGACVGAGWTAEALATPVRVNLATLKVPNATWPTTDLNLFAKRLYLAAQHHDQWPGGEWLDPADSHYYQGSSVVAGAKQMQRLGLINEYRWGFSTAEMRDGILALGPAVLGVNWRTGMFDPDPNGVVHVTGTVAGGHCLLANGYQPDRDLGNGGLEPAFRLTNSWSASWADAGGCWISEPDMATLLQDQGECCIPVHRSYGPQISTLTRLARGVRRKVGGQRQ